ncbi:MAG: ribonuclease H-like domain-containing protein [Dehalococcoidia bacterium]|nr:ribonuclease H-like domain-containing protein [Dehalococcoidia bacterium]
MASAVDFVVLDIETAGGSWREFPVGFNLLFVGVRRGSDYSVYTNEPASLAELAATLRDFPGVVVTYNGNRFDIPIIDHTLKTRLEQPLAVKRHYDMLEAIQAKSGRRVRLDDVSYNTLGAQKAPWGDHRDNARVWAQEPERFIEYNRIDLDLTHDLFRRVLRGEPLFLGFATVTLDPP